MRIGEFAARVGVTARALRYYESVGLLSTRRDGKGHRQYDGIDLRIVTEIRTLVDLGFALEETRPFIECLRAGHNNAGSCADSLAVYRQKLAEVDGYMTRLQAVRQQIETQMLRAMLERAGDEPRCEFS